MEVQSNNSPLSPHFAAPPHIPSPPPASSGAGVRRHVSLTYGAAVGGPRKIASSGLKRSGTLQAPMPNHSSQTPTPPDNTVAADDEEYEYDAEDPGAYEDEYYKQQQYPTSPVGRSSPWTQGNDWRTSTGQGFSGGNGSNATIDDVQRALSTLELASNNNNNYNMAMYHQQQQGYPVGGQSVHPPRFNPSHPPPAQAPGIRGGNNGGNGNGGNGNGNGGRKLQLVTDFEGRKTPSGGTASTSAYPHQQYSQQPQQQPQQQQRDDRAQTAGGSWDQKDRILGNRTSNPNLQYGYQQQGGQHGKSGSGSSVPNVPPIPQQYLQQQQGHSRVGSAGSFGQGQQGGQGGGNSGQGFVNTPIDVPSLIATKGYNPTNFDTRPQFVNSVTFCLGYWFMC